MELDDVACSLAGKMHEPTVVVVVVVVAAVVVRLVHGCAESCVINTPEQLGFSGKYVTAV